MKTTHVLVTGLVAVNLLIACSAPSGEGTAQDSSASAMVETEASDAKVSASFVESHIQVGIEALRLIRRNGKSVRHQRF